MIYVWEGRVLCGGCFESGFWEARKSDLLENLYAQIKESSVPSHSFKEGLRQYANKEKNYTPIWAERDYRDRFHLPWVRLIFSISVSETRDLG